MNYFSKNIGDWIKHCASLKPHEECFYSRLCDHYYITESPLDADFEECCRVARVRDGNEDDRKAVAYVLRKFFVLEGGQYHHERCDEEIAAYQAKAGSSRQNGKKGGRPRNSVRNVPCVTKPTGNPAGFFQEPSGSLGKNPIGNPDGTKQEPTKNLNQEPITNNQEETPPNPRKRGQGFDANTAVLPDWLPAEIWQRWVDARRQARKPITEIAAQQQIRDLTNWRAAGYDAVAIIEESIRNGWQGLFAPKGRPPVRPAETVNGIGLHPAAATTVQSLQRAMDRMAASGELA